MESAGTYLLSLWFIYSVCLLVIAGFQMRHCPVCSARSPLVIGKASELISSAGAPGREVREPHRCFQWGVQIL